MKKNLPDYYRINGDDSMKFIVGIVEANHLSAEEGIYLFNTLKYLVRFNNKNGIGDLLKATDYLNRLTEVYANGIREQEKNDK